MRLERSSSSAGINSATRLGTVSADEEGVDMKALPEVSDSVEQVDQPGSRGADGCAESRFWLRPFGYSLASSQEFAAR